MTEIIIGGRIESALTHFAGLGLAAIVDATIGGNATIRWTEEETPELIVQTDVPDRETVAAAVHAMLADRAADSWVTARMTHEGRSGTGTFSPRIKAPSSTESWHRLQTRRHTGIDALVGDGDLIDLQMIGALGEPAYWAERQNKVQPDSGASRLEMKTRNSGEEFIGHRFSRMHEVVAARTPTAVLSGITGESLVDELGGRDSQIATGMQLPGPVDVAQALVALWGITAVPPMHRVNDMSVTPGFQPQHRVHPEIFVLPVPTRRMTVDKIKAICATEWLQTASDAVFQGAEIPLVVASRFREHGIGALVKFPVRTAGSSTAPQRFLLDGELVLWD